VKRVWRWLWKERPWHWRPAFILESDCRWAFSIIPFPYLDWSEDMPRRVKVWSLGTVGIRNESPEGDVFYDFDSFGVAYRLGPWTLKLGIADDD
jgi:hypothetical protein